MLGIFIFLDHLFRVAYVADYSIVPLGLPLSTRKLRKKAATKTVLGVGVEGRRNLKILTLGNGVQHLPIKVTYNIKPWFVMGLEHRETCHLIIRGLAQKGLSKQCRPRYVCSASTMFAII